MTPCSELAALRKLRGWTQTVAAKVCRVNTSTLANYEIGRFRPSFPAIERMAQAYGVSASTIVAALPPHRPRKEQTVPKPKPKPQKPPKDIDDDDDDDAGAEVLMAPSRGKVPPSWAIDPGTLMDAVRKRINVHRKNGDESYEYAARALLACLRVGNIEQIADALVEHFKEIEDYDDDDDDDEDEN